MPFIPVVDGDLLGEHPMAAFFGAANSGIPLLTGTNLDEENLFLVPTGITGFVTDEVAPALAARTGAGPDVFKLYQANRPDASAGTVYSAFLTDAYFRLPALAVADARRSTGGRTWVYEFAQPDSRLGMGACHGLEVGYVFDNLYADGNEMLSAVELTDPAVRQDLATAMHRAWMAFARTGDPGLAGLRRVPAGDDLSQAPAARWSTTRAATSGRSGPPEASAAVGPRCRCRPARRQRQPRTA